MIEFTFGQFVDAMEKNGYPKAIGSFIRRKNGEIKACAIGQAALNLGVRPESLNRAINKVLDGERFPPLTNLALGEAIGANDNTDKTVPQIAQMLRDGWTSILDTKIPYNLKFSIFCKVCGDERELIHIGEDMFDCFACGTSYSSEDGVIDHENVEYYSAQYKAGKNISGAEENLLDIDFIRDEEKNK